MSDLTVTKLGEVFGEVRLQISGLLVDSMRGVDEVQTKTDGSTMNVLVLVVSHGKPPGFQKVIVVPFYVRRLTFGPEESPIWERE
jgi:hypothetical protein